MKSPLNIAVPSLAEAVTLIGADPAYAFHNSWLIDVDNRIKSFTYEGQHMIAKHCVPAKGIQEVAGADRAQLLLDGQSIGEQAIVAAVPKMASVDETAGYLVSDYIGPDINEHYYRQESVPLLPEAWASLVRLLGEHGIGHGNLLPRNLIVSPDQIAIIDWEGTTFDQKTYMPDRLAWTGLTIAWSYIYGIDVVKEVRSELSGDEAPPVKMTSYEEVFSQFLGYKGDLHSLRRLVCDTAVAAEAERGHAPLSYKLDDAFHIISEQLPLQIEVLLDILLAAQEDTDHSNSAQLIAEVAKDLYCQSLRGNGRQAVGVFKDRCARLALLLTDENMRAETTTADRLHLVDSVEIPSQSLITDRIREGIIRSYENARPETALLTATAKVISSITN